MKVENEVQFYESSLLLTVVVVVFHRKIKNEKSCRAPFYSMKRERGGLGGGTQSTTIFAEFGVRFATKIHIQRFLMCGIQVYMCNRVVIYCSCILVVLITKNDATMRLVFCSEDKKGVKVFVVHLTEEV